VSNASTIRRQVSGTQQLTLAPLTSAVIGGTATAFKLNDNGLTLTGGGVVPLAAGVTGLYAGTGQVLHIRAAGVVTSSVADVDLVLSLYQVPASLLPIADTLAGQQTFTSWNLIGSSTVAPVDTALGNQNFNFDAEVQLAADGSLQGDFWANVANVVTQQVHMTTPITGLVGEADLNFAMVATISTTTTTGTVITLDEFAIDLK